jgi:UDPglucose 6-dehydrogenase
MRIVVYGLWHLGCVTAACLAAAGRQVVGLDPDRGVVDDLATGKAPLHEPGLDALTAEGLQSGHLRFTTEPGDALSEAEVVWVTFDTPVNDSDEADVDFVRRRLEAIASFIPRGTLVLLSAQVPVGFTGALERDWQGRGLRFAYSPENLRLGKALDSFRKPERVVVGVRDPADRTVLAQLFEPYCEHIEWMSIESGEMTKHALNAFLATSVTFINELARLCEAVGADAKEVERGLKSEGRIGPRAYLSPGAAFAGGTLARDLRYLTSFGRQHQVATPLCTGVLSSNEVHKGWVSSRLSQLLGSMEAPVAAVLGLTYKPGTSTLRRSTSLEHCAWLHYHGVRVQAHDPAVTELPDELRSTLTLCASAQEALAGADVVLVATEWPDYRRLDGDTFVRTMRRPCVIDPNHFLGSKLAVDPRITYVATGKRAAA